MPSPSSLQSVALKGSIQSWLGLSRMVLQRELIGCCLNVSQPCWTNPDCPRPSGVNVWNRCPTDAVKGQTPYQLWTGTKPDVSHLRVWGCTAYVHIQKDKREGLGSHMEKCVFIGYPQGYKGWKFYNPTTKKTIISERADFDERYFPMSKGPTAASFLLRVQKLRVLLLPLQHQLLGRL